MKRKGRGIEEVERDRGKGEGGEMKRKGRGIEEVERDRGKGEGGR